MVFIGSLNELSHVKTGVSIASYQLIMLFPFLSQFCDFNSKPEDVCKVISDLQSDGQSYDSFGKPVLMVCIYILLLHNVCNFFVLYIQKLLHSTL